MLVLTRKKGERVMIGDDIVVTVIDVRGDGVRIGFDAPRGIPIQRAEVILAVTQANAEAVATSGASADALVGLLTRAHPGPPAAASESTRSSGSASASGSSSAPGLAATPAPAGPAAAAPGAGSGAPVAPSEPSDTVDAPSTPRATPKPSPRPPQR